MTANLFAGKQSNGKAIKREGSFARKLATKSTLKHESPKTRKRLIDQNQ